MREVQKWRWQPRPRNTVGRQRVAQAAEAPRQQEGGEADKVQHQQPIPRVRQAVERHLVAGAAVAPHQHRRPRADVVQGRQQEAGPSQPIGRE